MGKKSKRRQKGSSSSSIGAAIRAATKNNQHDDDDDAFLEQAIQIAAAEKKKLQEDEYNASAAADDARMEKMDEDEDPLEGLTGFDRLQAVGSALGVTVFDTSATSPTTMRLSPAHDEEPDPVTRAAKDWNTLYPQPETARLMTEWEKSMDNAMCYEGMSKFETMVYMAITPDLVKGIRTGDWTTLVRRIMEVDKPLSNTTTTTKFRPGDYIEVMKGNHIKWNMVGERGILCDYFEDEDKWGIEMDNPKLGPSLVCAGNLKLIKKGHGFADIPGRWTRRR